MAVDPLENYRLGAIAFHWTMAVLVVVVGVLGVLHDSWPKDTQADWINVHALMGMLLWALLFVRFAYRLRHRPPALPRGMSAFARQLAGAVHLTLYALMFVIPIFGFVTFIYHGRVFHFGLFDLDFQIKKDRTIFEPTEDIHGYLAYALFALAAFHVLAALRHQVILRDGLIARMWPARRPRTK